MNPSPAARRDFARDGYVMAGRLFDAHEVDQLRAISDRVTCSVAPGQRPERVLNPHLDHADFCAMAAHPALIAWARHLLGPDLVLFGTRLLNKPAQTGAAVGWHQDAPFFPVTPCRIATFWVALDPTTSDNGAMRVAVGDHRGTVLPHSDDFDGVFDEAIPDRHIDADRTCLLTLEPGDVSVHDAYTPHASGPNRTDRDRRAAIFRYMPADCVLDRTARSLYGSDYQLMPVG